MHTQGKDENACHCWRMPPGAKLTSRWRPGTTAATRQKTAAPAAVMNVARPQCDLVCIFPAIAAAMPIPHNWCPRIMELSTLLLGMRRKHCAHAS